MKKKEQEMELEVVHLAKHLSKYTAVVSLRAQILGEAISLNAKNIREKEIFSPDFWYRDGSWS
ncbi:MAG: hypothetical protein AAGD28_01310 [Bacteroidota bacterium]